MKFLAKALVLFTLFAWPFLIAQAQTPAERTDLVIMLIWQADDGAVMDKRYIRHTESSEEACLDARGGARLIWSARKNSNMVGQSICLAPGDPVPTLGIGTFQVIVEGTGATAP